MNGTEGKNDEISVELNVQTRIESHVGKEIQPDQTVGEKEMLITADNNGQTHTAPEDQETQIEPMDMELQTSSRRIKK